LYSKEYFDKFHPVNKKFNLTGVFRMKKSLITLAALASMAAAHADGSSVQVYGILDEGVAHVQHSLAFTDTFVFSANPYNVTTSASPGVTGMVSGGASMSRWGIKGNEDLGGGVSAFFTLESAFNVGNGSLSNNGQTGFNQISTTNASTSVPSAISGSSSIDGQLFSRAAFVGIGDKTYGSIQLGRTTNLNLEQTAAYDPLSASGLYSPLGFAGAIGGGMGVTENARLDDSIKYQNTMGPIMVGLQYKFGNKSASEVTAIGSATVATIGYAQGPLAVQLTGSQTQNSAVASFNDFNNAANKFAVRIANSQGFMLTGKYDISAESVIKAGFEQTELKAASNSIVPTSSSTYFGMVIPAGTTLANWGTVGYGPAKVTTAWVGGTYKFSPAFDLSAAYYNINNAAILGKKDGQYTISAFSLLADYHFSKMADVYGGLMVENYAGTYITGGTLSDGSTAAARNTGPQAVATNNAIYGAGLRVKF
jgi:predicted porin